MKKKIQKFSFNYKSSKYLQNYGYYILKKIQFLEIPESSLLMIQQIEPSDHYESPSKIFLIIKKKNLLKLLFRLKDMPIETVNFQNNYLDNVAEDYTENSGIIF